MAAAADRLSALPDDLLQHVLVDNAPALTSLVLVNLRQNSPEQPGSDKTIYMHSTFSLRLRCPKVTALVLETHYLGWHELDDPANTGIELDMPSLRSFRYSGYPLKLSLASPAPALARVNLDATRRDHSVQQYEPTSRVLTRFSSTRALKLRLDNIEDILAGRTILPTFPNLKLLQVHGKCKDGDRSTTVAVARLLASCPAMSELRLRLEMSHHYWYNTEEPAGGPFGESMDRFERLACMSSAHRDAVQLDGVSGLPNALTNSKFVCLETTLHKVTLQFKAREVNCFQVRLAKFLVENAMVLQEMHVDDGSQFWSDHLSHKVARWRAGAFQARNLRDTAGFRVYH
uniref:FBD domain-containing protein n=1 Tax=Aegilops tauschii TaxID=37682 RepID=R7WEH1_AEGTA